MTKKIFSGIVCIVLALAMAVPVFAGSNSIAILQFTKDNGETCIIQFDNMNDANACIKSGAKLMVLNDLSKMDKPYVAPLAAFCCDPSTMVIKTINYTLHQPVSLPGYCTVTEGISRICQGCGEVWFATPTPKYTHYHNI